MASVFQEKNIVEDKEPSILKALSDEELKYVEDVEPRFHLDEDIEADDVYKWYEIIDGEKVKRNNIDPNLTCDGLPTLEVQLKQLEELDNERFNRELSEEDLLKKHRKEMLQRIRCIALDNIGKNILLDPRKLLVRDKKNFISNVVELYKLSEDEIKIRFGNICHETIFQEGTDYSGYIVCDV